MTAISKLLQVIKEDYSEEHIKQLNLEMSQELVDKRNYSLEDYDNMKETMLVKRATREMLELNGNILNKFAPFIEYGTAESLHVSLSIKYNSLINCLHAVVIGNGNTLDELEFEVAPIYNSLASVERLGEGQKEVMRTCELILEAIDILTDLNKRDYLYYFDKFSLNPDVHTLEIDLKTIKRKGVLTE